MLEVVQLRNWRVDDRSSHERDVGNFSAITIAPKSTGEAAIDVFSTNLPSTQIPEYTTRFAITQSI